MAKALTYRYQQTVLSSYNMSYEASPIMLEKFINFLKLLTLLMFHRLAHELLQNL